MSDIYDALISGQVDPAALAAGLRKQQGLGTLAALTGIAGLQKLGPQMVSSAQTGAQDYATLRDRSENQKLQRLQAYQAELDRKQQQKDALEERRQYHEDADQTRRDIAAEAAQARKDTAQGKVDTAQEKIDLAKKAKSDAAENISAMYDDMITKAKAIKDDPALSRVTGAMDYFPSVKGSHASNVESMLHSLSSETALNAIQALRQNGGTLGRVTNMEIPLLQSSISPLSTLHNMSTPAAQEALQHLIDYASGARKRLRSAAGIVDEEGPAPADPSALPGAQAMASGGAATPNNPLETAGHVTAPPARASMTDYSPAGMKAAPDAAVKMLLSNPALAPAFKAKYGYLPTGG